MKRIYFKDMRLLAAYMLDKAYENKSVMAVLYYDKAKELMHEMAKHDDIDINSICLEPEDWDGYVREYYITLTGKFGIELFVDKGYNSKSERYLNYENDYVIFSGDAHSQIVKMNLLDHAINYEAVFDDGDIDCDDCDYYADFNTNRKDICNSVIDIIINGERYETIMPIDELFDFLTD